MLQLLRERLRTAGRLPEKTKITIIIKHLSHIHFLNCHGFRKCAQPFLWVENWKRYTQTSFWIRKRTNSIATAWNPANIPELSWADGCRPSAWTMAVLLLYLLRLGQVELSSLRLMPIPHLRTFWEYLKQSKSCQEVYRANASSGDLAGPSKAKQTNTIQRVRNN